MRFYLGKAMPKTLNQFTESIKKVSESVERKSRAVHFTVKPTDFNKLDVLCKHFGLSKIEWLEAMIEQSFEAYLEDQ